MDTIRKILVWVNIWRVFPAWCFYRTCKFHEKCRLDLEQWVLYEPNSMAGGTMFQLGYCLLHVKENRNIFLNRLKRNLIMYGITRLLFPPLTNCYVSVPPEKLGGGFMLEHGFATIVSAAEVGERCRVNQQVTIGHLTPETAPILGDDVMVCAGAIVVGGIHVGSHARIGAGAVVLHDVPEYATVVGQEARVVKIRKPEQDQ